MFGPRSNDSKASLFDLGSLDQHVKPYFTNLCVKLDCDFKMGRANKCCG